MNYSEMEDFTISVLVGRSTGLATRHDSALCLVVRNDSGLKFDPVNSWADAGPIIVSNLIALKPVPLFVGGHRWFATKGEGDFGIKTADNNPLRAAMIVFLMMQEKKDE